jgi:hypothetical protein
MAVFSFDIAYFVSEWLQKVLEDIRSFAYCFFFPGNGQFLKKISQCQFHTIVSTFTLLISNFIAKLINLSLCSIKVLDFLVKS